MAKYGFFSVLEEELEKHFHYDFAIDWDKKNHAVEVSFVLEVQNIKGIETLDIDGVLSTEDIALEEFILFYNPQKTKFDLEDYLVTIPYDAKKGFSREFLAYFADFLNQITDDGLDDLLDFLADEDSEEFEMKWDADAFESGLTELSESTFYPYPRY